MSKRDIYEILGVDRKASDAEIKKAYRKLAKEHHPDRNRGDASAEAKFKEVQHAYSVLSDKEKRAQYDQFGEIGVGEFQTNPHGQKVYTWGTDGSQIDADDLDSLFGAFRSGGNPFESIFGGRRGRQQRRAQAGADLRRTINLSFEQAVKGAEIEVDMQLNDPSIGRRETLKVKVPSGVEDGQQIRLKGRGGAGSNGGPRGDLFFICRVRAHPVFRRMGRDIYADVHVDLAQAVLGAKVDVKTLDGEVTLTIPAGTSSGAKMRLRGRGVPASSSSPAGDLIANIQVDVPASPSDEQKELMRQFAATLSDPKVEQQS
ncbi:MAG: molecular chaperone DnaJ [Phycisphaerae bacterium]|nr:MAG: molecular chaperone DnaJ [Phycisphaerae bacterium]